MRSLRVSIRGLTVGQCQNQVLLAMPLVCPAAVVTPALHCTEACTEVPHIPRYLFLRWEWAWKHHRSLGSGEAIVSRGQLYVWHTEEEGAFPAGSTLFFLSLTVVSSKGALASFSTGPNHRRSWPSYCLLTLWTCLQPLHYDRRQTDRRL